MKTSLILITLTVSTFVFGQNLKNDGSYPDDEIPFYKANGVKMSKKTKTQILFAGINDEVVGIDANSKALNWISQRAEQIGVKRLEDLQIYWSKKGLSGTNVRLQQYYEGIPVYQSEIVVHVANNGFVTYVYNSFDPTVIGIETTPILTEDMAFELALESIDAQGNIGFSSNELMIYAKDVNLLVYKILIEPESPMGSWEIIVNATTGQIIRKADKSCNHDERVNERISFPPPPVAGTGNVFLPDPLSVALAQYGSPYDDSNDATNASLDATMSTVTLLDINFTGSQYQLVGPYAEVIDFENPWKGLFEQASPDFNFNRNDDAFEAVNCYYHIDLSMRYINETLGTSCMPFQYSGGVQYDPSGLNGQDNSHYLGGSGRVAFGEGGVDDAEDADVILHELGHGIHDWLTGGNLSQVNGLSEGSGDYWATSYSRSLNQWTPSDPEYNWMFSWDGHNPFWNGRITNYTATYPTGLTGAIHTDGQIWCTALMRIYDIIGRTKVDKAFLEGLAMTGSNTSQEDAAIAVRQAAIDLGYSCEDIDVFTQEFEFTGYNMPALSPPSGTVNETLCYGESLTVNGTLYDASNPNGSEIFPGATTACDSTVTVSLSFYPELASTINGTLCFGESMIVNGTVYDENNPSGVEVFTNIGPNGCDSTVTINLSFDNQASSTIDGYICQGESILVNGNTYDYNNPTGSETIIGGSASGCDSVITVNLTPYLAEGFENGTLCATESVIVNGTTYDISNPSGTEVFTNMSPSGCDSTVYIDLTFEAVIDATVANNSPTLTANAAGAQYQWIDCDNGNQPISGETGQSFTATSNGNYAVQVTVGNCSENSECINVNNVGIDNLNFNNALIYPNPSSGLFTVSLGQSSSNIHYAITSLDGKVVLFASHSGSSEFSLDLSKESKGVYFLHMNMNDVPMVFKLVVE